MATTAVLPPRSGGSWDDLSEQQVQLTLSEAEHKALAASDSSPQLFRRTPLLKALSFGVRRQQLKVFTNPPRYDRLVVQTTRAEGGAGIPGSACYVVEADIDAWEGTGSWTTKNWLEADLVGSQSLVQLTDAEALEAEFGGALAFLDLCKRLGGGRYTMKTDLDPDAKPHVIRVVEKVIADSALRFLLSEEALERADGA